MHENLALGQFFGPLHAWKKSATRRPGRRETGDVSGKFVGKNEEGKGKEEGKMRKERERRGKNEEGKGKKRGK